MTAPHVFHASQAQAEVVLHPGMGLWRAEGQFALDLNCHRLCYFLKGRANFGGLEVGPDTVVHFKTGWSGTVTVEEPLLASYMECPGQPGEAAVLREAAQTSPQKEWGPIPTMIEGVSQTSGILLARDSDGRAESGQWNCTPGLWQCHVTSDEFCHFVAGRCTYTHESGEIFEVQPDTLAFFPLDWRGTCRVHETVRKIYLIR